MSSLFETGVRPLVDEYIEELTKQKRDYGKFWSASSAGYCMRLNILKRLEIPPVPEIADDAARTHRVFEAGHVFHEWLQRITKNTGISVLQEVRLEDEDLLVRGHFDDLVKIEDKLILYDYKTANSKAFNYKRPEIGHYHASQLATYMYMLRKGGQYLPEEARILTISKDDLRMREQKLEWSAIWEKRVVDYWRTINGYWSKKMLPKCTCLDHDGGFMGKRSKKGKIYNPYYYRDEPCSLEWVADKLPKDWR
jgi:hypothetical protein